ncbi:hypothetical protein [Chryseobacterium sp.]|uniref:hypothetical protein n=1 Tax=Chryseobacterium sp. TaxID=1871047 RepID=UPI0031E253D7
MKTYLKDYAELLSAIVLLFYILGFCYQFWYYQYFSIEIQYYVSLTDIIFQSIGNILLSIFFFVLIEIFVIFIIDSFLKHIYKFKNQQKFATLNNITKKRSERYLEYLIDSNRHGYSLMLCILAIFMGIFLFPDPIYFVSLLFVNFIYHLYKLSIAFDKNDSIRNTFKNASTIIVFIILIFTYSYWGLSDAWSIARENSSKVIKINDLSTGDGINKFIGETSTHIFILNTQTSDVIVFNKDGNSTFVISKNNYLIKEVDEFGKKIKNFIEKIQVKK